MIYSKCTMTKSVTTVHDPDYNILEQWYQPGVRVPPGGREDILGGT
jgi:hypothetical protein